jgi:hypothetical protein
MVCCLHVSTAAATFGCYGDRWVAGVLLCEVLGREDAFYDVVQTGAGDAGTDGGL